MKKILDVVCVTIKPTPFVANHDSTSWHQNITGKAIFDTEYKTVQFERTGDEIHRVIYTGSGLDGTSFLIGIIVVSDGYRIWELYTDLPAENSKATPEIIREKAAKAKPKPFILPKRAFNWP